MNKRNRILYTILIVIVVFVFTISSTYAFWVATANSKEKDISTESTTFSISMQITPLYPNISNNEDFFIIPMNDDDVIKALSKTCRDKYNRGACYAYKIRVYDYSKNLDYVSGKLNILSNNMQNVSYMMFEEQEEINIEEPEKLNEKCVTIDEKNYCQSTDAHSMKEGENLSLGNKYDVSKSDEKNFIIVLWLSNLGENQNDIDIGSFNGIITMQAGDGGEIKGSIALALKPELPQEEEKTDEEVTE